MSSIAHLENSLHSWEKEGFGEFLFMLGRVGFLLAASVVAYAVKRPKSKTSRLKSSENGGASKTDGGEAPRKEGDEDSNTRKVEKEDEEAEEVKTMNSSMNATVPSNAAPDHLDDDDDDEELLPEFESLLSGEADDDIINPLPENKYDAEVERLRRVVKELEEREAKLEAELLVYYGLEEELMDLQKQLLVKTEEVGALSAAIRSLQEEAAAGAAAAKELEVMRGKNEELQLRIQLGLDAGGGSGSGAPAWTTPW